MVTSYAGGLDFDEVHSSVHGSYMHVRNAAMSLLWFVKHSTQRLAQR